MSSAPLFYLKGLGRFFIFISTSLPCGAQKKLTGHLDLRPSDRDGFRIVIGNMNVGL
jgi:hypothetical protein